MSDRTLPSGSVNHATFPPPGVAFSRFDGMEQDDNGIWTSPGGGKVAWFTDPDGNVLSLTQGT